VIGGLIVDKPEGWTSHDVVGRIRRLANTRRVGHTGTLDPFATGVLVVCVGPATRLSQLLAGCEKRYRGTIRLGWATDTQDRTGTAAGEMTAPERIPDDPAVLAAAVRGLNGDIEQLPPMYSAKKVDGRALYKHARAGREIERTAVRVRVAMDIIGTPRRQNEGWVDIDVDVVCSAGTYVRTLAHDLGEALGCGAHLLELRRVRVGRFTIDEAATLDDLAGSVASRLVAPADLVAHLPRIDLLEMELAHIANGRAVGVDGRVPATDGEDVALLCEGRLVAIARIDGALARPRIVLER